MVPRPKLNYSALSPKVILLFISCLICTLCIRRENEIFLERDIGTAELKEKQAEVSNSGDIVIAVFFELSGPGAKTGISGKRGVELAIESANEKKLFSHKIRILEFDNRSVETGAELACKQILEKKPVAVIGPNWSALALTCAPKLQEAKIPMIVTLATHPDVTRAGDYIFRTCFTDEAQGQYMASYAREKLKLSSILILKDVSSAYSVLLADSFKKSFEKKQGTITEMEFTKNQTEKEMQALAQQARKFNPQAIYLPAYNKIAGPLAKMIRLAGINAILLGSDGWGTDKEIFLSGERYILDAYVTAHWHYTQTDKESLDFMFRFSQKFVEVPDQASALAYDAANMLLAAILKAGFHNSEALKNTIRDNAHTGVTGIIRYRTTGDPIKPGIIVITVPFASRFLERIFPQ